MGVGHGHGHASAGAGGTTSGHAGGRHRWRLAISFAMIAAFFLVELVVGIVSGSLALISDAGHMAGIAALRRVVHFSTVCCMKRTVA